MYNINCCEVVCMDKVKMGKFIGELRRAKHLTQTQLADKISVERETVSK